MKLIIALVMVVGLNSTVLAQEIAMLNIGQPKKHATNLSKAVTHAQAAAMSPY